MSDTSTEKKTGGPPPPDPAPVTLPVEQDWLADVINREYGTNVKIDSVQCELLGEGKGFVSVITKATPTYSNDNGPKKPPKAVAIKIPTDAKIKQIPLMAQMFSEDTLMRIHNREVDAYDYFTRHLPAPFPMARIVYKKRISAPGLEDGMIISEVVDGRSLTFNEDMTLGQIYALTDHVAALQAYAFKHPDYKGTIDTMPFDGFDIMFDKIPENTRQVRKDFPDIVKVTDEQVEKATALIREKLKMLFDPDLLKANNYTPSLSFGDMQPNNILWVVNEDGTLSDKVAALLDFQIVNAGPAFYDLLSFLEMSMNVPETAAHKDKIIPYFHKQLTEKCGGKAPVTIEELERGREDFQIMYALMGINMGADMARFKTMFGLSDQRIQTIVGMIPRGFERAGL